MKTLVRVWCGLLALLVLVGPALAQDAIQLKYQFKKGENYIYRQTTKMNQVQKVQNQMVVTEISQNNLNVLTPQEVDAKGNFHIKSENKLFVVKVKIPTLGDYTFDSRKKDNDKGGMLGGSLTPLYEKLSGANVTVVVSPQGKLIEIKGLKELLADVLKDNPLAAQFAGGGGDDAAKISFEELFPALPDKAVSPGDKWDTPFELKLPQVGVIKGKKVYWYQGEGTVGKKKTVRIDVATEMALDLNIEMGGAKITGKMAIDTSKGTIHFDPQAGCVVSIASEYSLGGKLNVNVNGMDIPVGTEQTQQVTLELLDALPKE